MSMLLASIEFIWCLVLYIIVKYQSMSTFTQRMKNEIDFNSIILLFVYFSCVLGPLKCQRAQPPCKTLTISLQLSVTRRRWRGARRLLPKTLILSKRCTASKEAWCDMPRRRANHTAAFPLRLRSGSQWWRAKQGSQLYPMPSPVILTW